MKPKKITHLGDIASNIIYKRGVKDERQRIKEEIMKIKLKYHTHPTANFSDTLLFGLDEGLSEVLALLSEEDGK